MTRQIEHLEDEQLIVQSQRGKQAAFNELVKRYQKRVYRSIYPLVGNVEDAMDVTQEAFLKAYKAIDRFEAGRPFFPWIYKIARNLGLTSLNRKNRKGFSLSLDTPTSDDEAPLQVPDDRQDPRKELADQELQQLLSEALDTLKAEDREILFLKDFNQHSYKEISDILDIPMGTVMSRLYYARERLRSKMEKYLES